MKSLKLIISLVVFFTAVFMFGTASVYALEHQHIFTELYTVKPTCTEKGYTVFCCDCGESYEGAVTDALGHIFSEESVCYKKATCLEKGESGRYCKRCFSKTDILYLPKTGHTSETVILKATAKRNGEKREECSVCKKVFGRKAINKIASVKLEKKLYTYDGKVKTPSVTVKDEKGKKLTVNRDYTLKYQKGRKKTGIYSVTVIFNGDYEGTEKLYFKIRPTAAKKITATPSISSVYLSWNKSKGADGYEIYLKNKKLKLIKDTENLSYSLNKIDGKKLKSGTDYVFVIKSYKKSNNTKIYSPAKTVKVSTRPQKSRIKKISVSARKVTVSAEKQNCHGYELLLSTNKSFSNAKTVKTKSKNNSAYTFKNLIKGKTYYVKVRAYVISGGEKYYGYYSNAKAFKV